ncbi:uroporphyrinogen-III synthase [Gayadomonas joobiniege]|uniref:uroporphyrinogen-III synthase n=1 Tax=Gayadomonas joobiniege TaxID=1234606 RepID=UPI0003706484|nr:uroporphyrinogen-III synthase [Gayadomonas joobiniege]
MKVYHSRVGESGNALNKMLAAHQWQPVNIPVLQISEGHQAPQLTSFNLQPDCLIVTSRHVVPYLQKYLPAMQWAKLKTVAVAAVGQGTANALQKAGFTQIFVPEEQTSEGLLTLTCITSAKDAVLFKGEQGRDKISQSLQLAKQKLTTYNVYKRQWLHLSNKQLQHIKQADIFVLTSGEIALTLHRQLSQNGISITDKLCLVPSSRICDLLSLNGFTQLVNLNTAANVTVMDYLKNLKGDANEQ